VDVVWFRHRHPGDNRMSSIPPMLSSITGPFQHCKTDAGRECESTALVTARGEAGVVQKGGGRFVTLACGSDAYHNPLIGGPRGSTSLYFPNMQGRSQTDSSISQVTPETSLFLRHRRCP
jgi:hypothetical protein